jgi:major membrane immunogen (membrane-anchored lipoprotein)
MVSRRKPHGNKSFMGIDVKGKQIVNCPNDNRKEKI